MTITLKRAAKCAECGADIAAGTRANWYRNGAVYGLTCHERSTQPKRRRGEPIGQTLSRHDRYGFYSADGTRLGSSCGCIDYPCCGH